MPKPYNRPLQPAAFAGHGQSTVGDATAERLIRYAFHRSPKAMMSAADLCSGRVDELPLRALASSLRGNRGGLLLIVALLASGCIPVWTEAYYSPDAPDAILQSYRCGGGPRNIASFTITDVTVGYWADPGRQGVTAAMSLNVPNGHSARMLGTTIAARAADGNSAAAELRLISQGWQGWSGRRSESLPIGVTMVGQDREASAVKSPALFVMTTMIPVAVAEELVVVYPDFVVDDHVIEPREIRFRLKRHVQFMAPINC